MMERVHELPGTTFSTPTQRGGYDSEAKAVLTVCGPQRWLALAVATYHGQVHAMLGQTPAGRWTQGMATSGRPAMVTSEVSFSGGVPAGDPQDAVAIGVRDRPCAVLQRRAQPWIARC